ncbi:PP2C family protein-serine/threonine phosphatase [Stratiformator vulcanicus]|uniref:Phosphoserine phosphatase RsbU n=1 Tax=Stratiformator vulcanicus TaxID=2527980 RepID=A0A517R457_9PLAN|nr:PP2C family protein-serine/threonine phosphatase [Stratiformator vulcanicus]QDT38630.1 Phosphoserine phosphatase RsbU [Stratiformator vulcanicus]
MNSTSTVGDSADDAVGETTAVQRPKWIQSNWQQRLDHIVETMREMSRQSDPQEMVRAYGRRMAEVFPANRRISLSRRGLDEPYVRVTRFSEWEEEVNPWKQKDQLPLLEGGLFADLIYGENPVVIDELDVDADDPAAEFLDGQRSLMAIPMLDRGAALNMVLLARDEPAAFDREDFPEHVWLANLFGRATHNLVLNDQLREAYEIVDRELKVVADIQQALLPRAMPEIKNLEVAAYYRTSHRAGGDYYDFFPLRDGKWGILIADVSGHGTPAAVVMAITHSIAHMFPTESVDPGQMLQFINEHLSKRYTGEFGAFVTAFYGVFDSSSRKLVYASAGHNPPRLRRCGQSEVSSLDGDPNIPLGLMPDVEYANSTHYFSSGDRVVFYTDGITEAMNADGKLYGLGRLDHLLEVGCGEHAQAIADNIAADVAEYADEETMSDDRTLIVANVR